MSPLPTELTIGLDKHRLNAPPAGARAIIDNESPYRTFPETKEEISKGYYRPETLELPLSEPENKLLVWGRISYLLNTENLYGYGLTWF